MIFAGSVLSGGSGGTPGFSIGSDRRFGRFVAIVRFRFDRFFGCVPGHTWISGFRLIGAFGGRVADSAGAVDQVLVAELAPWRVFVAVRLVVGVDWLEGGLVSLVFSVLIGGFPGSAAELLSIGLGVTRSAG